MQKEKKRHHYIPQFYLKNFSDPTKEPYIWVYQKGSSKYFNVTAENIAFEKHYYSFEGPSGERDSETFENILSDIESEAAPVFRKILAREGFNKDEKEAFAVFLGFIITRVPNYRQNVEKSFASIVKQISINLANNPTKLKSVIREYEKTSGEKVEMPLEEVQDVLSGNGYEVHVRPEFTLEMMKVALRLVPIICKMKWAFLESTKDYKFLTSDNPVVLYDPSYNPNSYSGVGLLNKKVELTFPISSDLLLLGTWQDFKGYIKLDNNFVKEMNRRTVKSALRFVFSSQNSDGINRLVQKHQGSTPKL